MLILHIASGKSGFPGLPKWPILQLCPPIRNFQILQHLDDFMATLTSTHSPPRNPRNSQGTVHTPEQVVSNPPGLNNPLPMPANTPTLYLEDHLSNMLFALATERSTSDGARCSHPADEQLWLLTNYRRHIALNGPPWARSQPFDAQVTLNPSPRKPLCSTTHGATDGHSS